MYKYNLEEPAASWLGISDQEYASVQPAFDASTLEPTHGLDALIYTDPVTRLSPASHQTTTPLTVDIVNGELSPTVTTSEATSARAVMFIYDKLVRELPGLYNSVSHDASASNALDKLICEIIDPSAKIVPEDSRVDFLVVPYEGRSHCPFTGCRKNEKGWAEFRDARDHIWIDHLNRRFPCSLNGCQELFSRPYDRDRHEKEHEGLGKIFVCPTCKKTFRRKFNLGRHIETTVCNRPSDKCSKYYSKKGNLNRHAKLHNFPNEFSVRRSVNRPGC